MHSRCCSGSFSIADRRRSARSLESAPYSGPFRESARWVIAQMVPGYLENPPGEIRTVSPVVQVPMKLEKGLLYGVLGIGLACTSAHQVTAQWTAQFLEPMQKLLARLIRS